MRERRLRVFIVEDEALVAMLLEDMLSELGHSVAGVAGRLDRALALAASVEADVAVLDLNLHGQVTFDVAAQLAARDIPIVFATGYGAAGLDSEWARRPVLQKPFQPSELRDAIARALAV